ncbi:Pyruvate/2-oxoglutarate dehydrogenase complex, dihydrolipoamide dehydrogenase (E3) component [Granulicella rosea]|uniref:Pyruvate/2-oxoglutarate dehydrogenase complex, dihydrolipoamide dehydrogenase (E3) component n=1 Tax=Granulicella rosea TaxID=474952 RepID=A0A239HK20_9BACT|nr:FAD-dependent oxidoreductase [Granulicella rosea]SNS81505.1 Pyruvate/2-oxoglutarate dehydrogenase complex, dihydrolipoamide dehydrogenase (E3) component [Granulicella rosea]
MTSIEEVAAIVPEEFDLVVLGSGEGSKFLAWTLARQGQRVAVVEHRWIGGSCPNIACLPSKNLIHSAKVASYFARAEEFGIEIQGYGINMARVTDRKRSMVNALVDIHMRNFENSGAELILGHGRFVGPRTIQVDLQTGGKRLLRGANVVIGTGTHASLDMIPGLAAVNPLTHIEALELEQVPPHLLILGGGYIGLEFAQAMRRLGSRVSVVDHNRTLLHREDPDVTSAIETPFREEGIDLILDAAVQSVTGTCGQAVKMTYLQDDIEHSVDGSHILVALGRTPNTRDIGLDLAGVDVNQRGYIEVDEHLRTSADGVWANGDVTGGPQFTHVAFDDFRILRDNLAGGKRSTKGRQIPFSLFTDPELARIGLSETEAKARGIAYRLFKIPMAADLRTRTLSETRGFMKALVGDDDRILGFTVFGVSGGEIMSAVQMAMIGNLPYTAIRDAVLAHPTLVEGLVVLFSSTPEIKAAP